MTAAGKDAGAAAGSGPATSGNGTGTGAAPVRRRLRALRPVLRTGAVLLAGAGLLLGAGAVADPVGLPGGAATGGVERAAGEALLTTRTLACPGPEQQGVTDGSVEEIEQRVRVQAVSPPAAALPEELREDAGGRGRLTLGGEPRGEPAPTEVTEPAEPADLELEGPRGAVVEAEGALAPGVVGAQLYLGQQEERRGLATAPCTESVTEAWLLAGGGQAGRAERLVLQNSGGNAVTVDVSVLGGEGAREAPGGQGVVVAPGQRAVLLVDALAPGEEAPVLHVEAEGGPVTAALGDRWLAGTRDLGMAVTPPAALPGTDLLVPGVLIPDSDRVRGSARLRVAAPGEAEAVVQVRVLTPEGPVRIDEDVTRVPAGQVADIPLGDLPAGTHAVQVRSDEPVVAAAMLSYRATDQVPQAHREGPLGDIAWLPATPPVGQLAGAPVAGPEDLQTNNVLALTAREERQVTVVTVDPEGRTSEQQVSVPAAATATVQAPAGGSVWVRGGGEHVHAALVTGAGDDAGPYLAATPLLPAPLTRDISSVVPWLP